MMPQPATGTRPGRSGSAAMVVSVAAARAAQRGRPHRSTTAATGRHDIASRVRVLPAQNAQSVAGGARRRPLKGHSVHPSRAIPASGDSSGHRATIRTAQHVTAQHLRDLEMEVLDRPHRDASRLERLRQLRTCKRALQDLHASRRIEDDPVGHRLRVVLADLREHLGRRPTTLAHRSRRPPRPPRARTLSVRLGAYLHQRPGTRNRRGR